MPVPPAVEDLPVERGLPPRMPLPTRAEHNWTAAVYLQVGYAKFADDMLRCAQAVASSSRLQHVDLFVSTIDPLPELEERLKRIAGLRQVHVLLAQNSGADIGQFLQLLQATPNMTNMTREQGVDADYDLILKMHTKSDDNWRRSAIGDLCASGEQVDKVVQQFQLRESLGMLGPVGLVFRPLMAYQTNFGQREVPIMTQVWDLMLNTTMPCNPAEWLIVAGSFYWARAGFFLSDPAFQAALPKLLQIMPPGYTRGACCLPPHGLERAIPTWITWRGYDVLPVRGSPHAKLIAH